MRKEFSFEAVSEIVQPDGASIAVFTVVNDATGQPLIADITNENNDRIITTDGNGQGEMGNLAAGATNFMVDADGYTPLAMPATMKTGTTSRFEVRLIPLFDLADPGNSGRVTQPLNSINASRTDQPAAFN